MRQTEYERTAQRDIEKWQYGEASLLQQALDFAMRPVDWAVEKVTPPDWLDQVSHAIESFLSGMAEASEWTYQADAVLDAYRAKNHAVESLEQVRTLPLDVLDAQAKSLFTESAVYAALTGGGTGLGGAMLIAADVPLLLGINMRLIQQMGACYGFSLKGPDYRPLVLALFNVAAAGSRESKSEALREISVAATAFARNVPYKARISGTWRDQSRQIPREIAKALLARKVLQTIPIAGAAVGAGVNYWFTTETAQAAFMLFRALSLETRARM